MAEHEDARLRDLIAVAGAAGGVVLVAFLAWEGVEASLAVDDATAHALHYARGISTSALVALAVGGLMWLQHRRRAEVLRSEVARRGREADEAGALLRLVVDNTPASLLVLDDQLNVVQANRTARRVHGTELVGHRCFESLFQREERCDDCPVLDGLQTGTAVALPAQHTDPRTGEILAVESHPLKLPDGRQYVLLVERILTEQKKLQARLVHQEKMAAFGLLAAGMAHDMGNPLASVEAQLQLLDPGRLPERARSVFQVVQQEVRRLQRTLRELVDFARRRRDEAVLASVQSVVDDALRLLRHDPRMRGVEVATDFDPETPPVRVVEDHLMQVVLNLILNALDAMPDGGTLRVELRSVGGRVALRVHDTGRGMDRSVLARCFEPLYTTKAPGKGTGLGLSISRDIVREAGGELELHSTPGRGTTALVVLPPAESRRALPVTAVGA